MYTSDLKRALLPPIPLSHLPVSLLLVQFGHEGTGRRRPTSHLKNHPTHLLIGSGDGNLHTYCLDIANGIVSIGEQKLIPLGPTKPVFVTPFRPWSEQGGVGEQSVLACGTRPVVLYWENSRLKHSPLVRKVSDTRKQHDILDRSRANRVSVLCVLLIPKTFRLPSSSRRSRNAKAR